MPLEALLIWLIIGAVAGYLAGVSSKAMGSVSSVTSS